MAVSSVQEAFVEFEGTAVRVPARQNERAKAVHPQIRAAVQSDLGPLFADAYLAGSYARRVQTVRLKDIDIIIVLNDPEGSFAASALAALERLRAAAHSCELVVGSTLGVRAVKTDMKDEEFTVDLVAALNDRSGEVRLARYLPEEGKDDWTSARPKAQLEAGTKKNADTDGVYVPGVRIEKFWNQRLGDGETNLLPSYLVESMLFHAMSAPCEFAEASAAFFGSAVNHLGTARPTVPCPGDPNNFVDERLEDDRRLRALAAVQEALTHVEAAEAASDVGEALDAWAQIYGPAFPAPCNDSDSLAKALKKGTAVASGTSIPSSGEGRPIIRSRSHRQDG